MPDGFHKVDVTVGISSDSQVQILSGLNETDEVYVPRTEITDMSQFVTGVGGVEYYEEDDSEE